MKQIFILLSAVMLLAACDNGAGKETNIDLSHIQ